jgi:hypothetical protein
VADTKPTFRELQVRLKDMWPAMTIREVRDVPRTVVVLHSIGFELPERWRPILPAYEERYLFYIVSLLTAPLSQVVYVTSLPVLPRVVDYWLSLVPGFDTPETRRRLTLLPVVDARPIPLTRKVLDHPGVMRRIREAVIDPRLTMIAPFMTTQDEVELSEALEIPVWGPDPMLAPWGTKTGSRRAFAEAGVRSAPGVERVSSFDDVLQAIRELRAADPDLEAAIVKLDRGVSGIGNGTIVLGEGVSMEKAAREIRLEEPSADPEEYWAELEREGGVVEAFVTADEVLSPSVQLRASPTGDVEVLSTHDQILGGPHGLSYLGCRMPAGTEYAAAISDDALRVGRFLAEQGAMGRFAIDFLAARRGDAWETYALEINLRNGGTTHPFLTLQALTNGSYDPELGGFRTPDGTPKYYMATDHLEHPDYARLTTDDFLDLLPRHGLAWNHERHTGAVFHLASAIGGTGVVGITAVGDDSEEARRTFQRARAALDAESSSIPP